MSGQQGAVDAVDAVDGTEGVDTPRAPGGGVGWDARSEGLLAGETAEAAGVPGLPEGGVAGPGAGAGSIPAFGEGEVGAEAGLGLGTGLGDDEDDSGWNARGEGDSGWNGRGAADSGWDGRGRRAEQDSGWDKRGGGGGSCGSGAVSRGATRALRTPQAAHATQAPHTAHATRTPHTPHVTDPVRAAKPARRGGADPVKALMHRHRDLCARAVDPLEIAAGLEAHGVTDRAAARFRHRDVFALAEEMYARVPRSDDTAERAALAVPAGDAPRGVPQVPSGWALFALLPGAVCAAAVAALGLAEGGTRVAVALGGALAVGAALRTALRYGPLRAVAHPLPATRAWACWLLAYALLGDGLLRGAVAGGPDGPGDLWEPAVGRLLGLALAVAPAVWCARLFAVRARGRLGASRGLDDFASSVRPLLFGVFALFLGALAALLAVVDTLLGRVGGEPVAPGGPSALLGAGALGALLLLARLLGVYGFTRSPALLLGAAGAAELAALAMVFAGRLPGCGALAAPVEAAVDAWGPGVVPAAACGAAALALLVHAARTLTLASAHAVPGEAP